MLYLLQQVTQHLRISSPLAMAGSRTWSRRRRENRCCQHQAVVGVGGCEFGCNA